MESFFTIFQRYLKYSILFSLVFFSAASLAHNHEKRENSLLSAFVYKVAKFVTWPQIDQMTRQDHFDLCVVDNAPFSQALKRAVNSRRIFNLNIHVKNVTSELALNHCHLLYFQNVNTQTVSKFLLEAEGKAILTVASSSNFIKQGGMIAFERTNNKISLSINNEQAKKEGLSISAHLLRLNRLKQ